ncbi:MAG: ABC-F family ATP-binding cassette domain-containing protein, partial [Mycoplasmatales bacterium]
MNILEVVNLEKSYFEKLLFKNVNIEIQKGDKVALIGHNGSGKTTLLKIITGNETIDSGSVFLNDDIVISYFDQFGIIDESMTVREILDIAFGDIIEVSSKLTLIEEKMSNTDNLDAVLEEYACVQEEFEALGGYDYLNEQNKFIQTFGLSDMLDVTYSILSGGERQYIRLALTIFHPGELIILDEPLSFFDRAKINWLTKFIKSSPKTFIIITHHYKFIKSFTNKILDVDNKMVTQYNCGYEEYIKEKIVFLKELEIENQRLNAVIDDRQNTVDKATRWMDTSVNAHRIALMIKRLEREIDKHEDVKVNFTEDKKYDFDLQYSVNEPVLNPYEIIDIKNVDLKFGDRYIFKNLNFNMNSDEQVSIVGSNGTGKTTFFKMLLEQVQPSCGSVNVDENLKIVFIAQEVSFEDDRMRVLDYCKQVSGLGDELAEESLLKLFDGDSEYFNKRLFTLSGGEKKRLQLLVHIVGNNNLLLIDEPTTFMDDYTKMRIVELIKSYKGAVILVTHEK